MFGDFASHTLVQADTSIDIELFLQGLYPTTRTDMNHLGGLFPNAG